jgi:replication-associated recombination protein RarA
LVAGSSPARPPHLRQGPPGTAKTSFARIVAEILFGLGKIQRPDIMEVTEEDLVVGYVSQTAQRMKEVCEEALGGVLFIDEAYRLVPEHEGHSFGKDAINTLLKYMEDFRYQLVVIVAGYPTEMRRFMAANPGLASRFHFTLTFESYMADEIVAIARHIAAKEKIAIAEQGRRGHCCRPRLRGCIPCQPIPAPRWMSRATDGMPARWSSPASAIGPGDYT